MQTNQKLVLAAVVGGVAGYFAKNHFIRSQGDIDVALVEWNIMWVGGGCIAGICLALVLQRCAE